MELSLDFRLVHGMPLLQGTHMGPRQPEIENGKILGSRPAEILAPGTPGVSHGTKIFCSKFFSYHENQMLFYAFCGLVMQK